MRPVRRPRPPPLALVSSAPQELRADLLAKMLKVNQDAATPAEKQAGGITKMRYLRFREGASTSSSLGFRIDAIQLAEGLHDAVR